jgi:hypothetical protein
MQYMKINVNIKTSKEIEELKTNENINKKQVEKQHKG